VAQDAVRLAKLVQGSLLPTVVGTGVEFGGYHCRQDGALEDPGVLTQPEVAFSPAKPDVNASVEEKRTGGE
jgi:hypothetical protein